MLDSNHPTDKALMTQLEATGELPSLLNECADHTKLRFAEVRETLDSLGIRYQLNTKLVRGLDYYCHTTFEFIDMTSTGQQNAVLAGGRYDGLSTALGGKELPGIG